MTVQVIEDHDDSGVHWSVSFTSHNPEASDCVFMASEEDAFKLKKILENDIVIKHKNNLV
jgi:hypothetical protein